MNFTEYLNQIYAELNCTQTELNNASGISAPAISRYLSGDREPIADSEHLKSLVRGICYIARSKDLTGSEFEYENLLQNFNKLILQKKAVYDSFVINFKSIIDSFNINMKNMASFLNFDVSYLYRIRTGERHPVDLNRFCWQVSEYIASTNTSEKDLETAANLFSCSNEELKNPDIYRDKIFLYLTHSASVDEDIPEMSDFLSKMDEFNLDEYIKVIHFDELKVPSLPFSLRNSKYYYGVNEMRNAELDFLKATVLGKSKEPVTMCSYMPMQEIVEDMDFGKKWMFGIAMMIKKGLHLNVIHNLDRPMNELMLGFEAWIPIYMTGQVSPYHIPNYSSDVFHQINYCSGNAALMGECIDGSYEDGRYYVTNNKSEITYYRRKTNALLKKAEPLMEVYGVENQDKFNAFIKKSLSTKANRRIISCSLPDFTLPADALEKHLADFPADAKDSIMSYIDNSRSRFYEITEDHFFIYDICEMSEEEYNANPTIISFPAIFSDCSFRLSYEEYSRHLEATKELAATNRNFKLNYVDTIPFNNIKIAIVSEKYFIVSKAKSPNIHFVIYHKKMLAGMENFYLAYKE